VSVAKKQGFAMSLWLHGDEDFISEAGAMNVWIIKEAPDGCKSLLALKQWSRADGLTRTFLPASPIVSCRSI